MRIKSSSPPEARQRQIDYAVYPLVLFLIQCGLYFRTLAGGPILDDFRLLNMAKHNGWLANFGSGGSTGAFWRPSVSVFLKAEWYTFHSNFMGYRMASIVLSSVTAWAICGIVFHLTKSRGAGLGAGLVFVLWPSHPETIVWIAGQTDGLATSLALVSLWIFLIDWTDLSLRPWRTTAWVALLAFALLAKESIVVFPVIVVLLGLLLNARHRGGRMIAFAGSMVAVTLAYLWLRSGVLHVSLFGGGYQGGSQRTLAAGIVDGFSSYHLTFNLMSAYVPLSNRVANLLPNTPPDAFLTLLITFGGSLVATSFPRAINRSTQTRNVLTGVLGIHVLMVYWVLFGTYPLLFLLAIAQAGTSGIFALSIIGFLCGYLLLRNRKRLGVRLSQFSKAIWDRANIVRIACALIGLGITVASIRGGGGVSWLYVFSLWSAMYCARPKNRTRLHGPERALLVNSAIFAAISIVALIPVLTVREVDANLAIARLSYLSTCFSIPAIVMAICGIIRSAPIRRLTLLGLATSAAIVSIPVIGVWSTSDQLSQQYIGFVKLTVSKNIFVLASPGVTPSATTIVLGGEFLKDSANLLRDDGAQVYPAYYADGLTQGDRLEVTKTSGGGWRIRAIAGDGRYRSGKLSLRPTFDPKSPNAPFASTTVAGDDRAIDIRIPHLLPSDSVVAVTDSNVIHLLPDQTRP